MKYRVRDNDGVWHVCIHDWTEGAPEGAKRCTYCGKQFLLADVSLELEVPPEDSWCQLPGQEPYPGTKLHNCVLYSSLKDIFWVGVPPAGEPVVVANMDSYAILPRERFERLVAFAFKVLEHNPPAEDNKYGMTDEEFGKYEQHHVLPGDIVLTEAKK